ncbi:MAG: methyltransferase type 12 [Cytophagaceae bacterium SCN 52-12]|nr:MAG: methyltransferase type 12 [Cytophagaceae bacterium SCN 52-12]
MSSNELTDRAFWLKYWENKKNLVFEIPSGYPFLSELDVLIRSRGIKTLLEIGGFPGYYSVWARRLGVTSTLLDFVVHRPILRELEKANHVPEGATGVVEADIFKLQADPVYDLVMSNGLIEHFNDTEDIVKRHTQFVRPGGALFISLPNFRGLNGWFQKTFDPANYEKHNIGCMDPGYLRSICENAGLENADVQYSGYFMLWLENPETQPLWVRAFMKLTWLPLKVFFKIFPFNSRAFSPYIVIRAVKPA